MPYTSSSIRPMLGLVESQLYRHSKLKNYRSNTVRMRASHASYALKNYKCPHIALPSPGLMFQLGFKMSFMCSFVGTAAGGSREILYAPFLMASFCI